MENGAAAEPIERQRAASCAEPETSVGDQRAVPWLYLFSGCWARRSARSAQWFQVARKSERLAAYDSAVSPADLRSPPCGTHLGKEVTSGANMPLEWSHGLRRQMQRPHVVTTFALAAVPAHQPSRLSSVSDTLVMEEGVLSSVVLALWNGLLGPSTWRPRAVAA